jgi:IS5 family transposase
VIVGVTLTNAGTDLGQLPPMVEQLRRRYGRGPAEVLADGGYVALQDIRALEGPAGGGRVYASPKTPRGHGRGRDWRRRNDEATLAWRTRMATDAAQAIYKERAATAECVNAQARNRGLQQLVVRGLRKARAVLLWFALAHNLLRGVALRHAALATG